jgi:hypothetical protein
MTVSAVSLSRSAFRLERRLPVSVRGPGTVLSVLLICDDLFFGSH